MIPPSEWIAARLSDFLQDPTFRKALVLATLAAVSSCHLQDYRSDPRPRAEWQRQFEALDCWNPRRNYDMPSSEPLLFAMIRICNKLPGKQLPHHGYEALVAIDAVNNEVRGLRISANADAGIHYTANGDLVWFVTSQGSRPERQRFIEAYALAKGAREEHTLGRIELPFLAGNMAFYRGGDCHVLFVTNYRYSDRDGPREWRFVFFRDDDPVGSARFLDDVGRILYWDAERRVFVIQREGTEFGGSPEQAHPLTRLALDCSGNVAALAPEVRARLEQVTRVNAQFIASATGDLLVNGTATENGLGRILVFHAGTIRAIANPGSPGPCYLDIDYCEPAPGFSASAWSPTGKHFLVRADIDRSLVYRTEDLQAVRRWRIRDSGDFPMRAFIDDHTAFQLNDHSRVSFFEW